MTEYTLKQLCGQCGVSRRAVQGYEKHNLVTPCGKTVHGYLLYDVPAVRKVKQIKQLQNYGFSLEEIADFFNAEQAKRISALKEKLADLRCRQRQTEVYISMLERQIVQEEACLTGD